MDYGWVFLLIGMNICGIVLWVLECFVSLYGERDVLGRVVCFVLFFKEKSDGCFGVFFCIICWELLFFDEFCNVLVDWFVLGRL